jgi:hypothetical protein
MNPSVKIKGSRAMKFMGFEWSALDEQRIDEIPLTWRQLSLFLVIFYFVRNAR